VCLNIEKVTDWLDSPTHADACNLSQRQTHSASEGYKIPTAFAGYSKEAVMQKREVCKPIRLLDLQPGAVRPHVN
jgi:hypothetical protein